MVLQGEILPVQLNASLSSWSDVWGHEKCSSSDERYVFSKVGIIWIHDLGYFYKPFICIRQVCGV